MLKDHIKVEGYRGTWYVVDYTYHRGQKVYLLEHEQYGDETACLIVNGSLEVIMYDVWNGFMDLEDLEG